MVRFLDNDWVGIRMKAPCPKCGKENEEKTDGYFWCNCTDVKNGSGGYWYLPSNISELKRKDEIKRKSKLFLDDEEGSPWQKR